MSNYQNFVKDFPLRCNDVLLTIEESKITCNREVTLMLMIATSGLSIPYERLRVDATFTPPYNDRMVYEKAAKQFDTLLQMNFLGSALWGKEISSWFNGQAQSLSETSLPWENPHGSNSSFLITNIKDLLYVIRNALAHGNLYTKSDRFNQIDSL